MEHNQQEQVRNEVYRPNKSLFYTWLVIGGILCFMLIGVPIVIAALLWYKFSYITLGENGVDLRKGWLNVVHKQVPYDKITTVEIQLGLLDRLFHTGQLRIFTGNDIQGIVFYGIDRPAEIKAKIESRAQERRGMQGAATTAPRHSSADELAKFAELKEKGIITEEEFEAKKKQLLS